MPDIITPNLITVAPTGIVGADFSGHVHAKGLDLDAPAQDVPPDDDKVRWILGNGRVLGQIAGFENLAGGSVAYMHVDSKFNKAIEIRLEAGNISSTAKVSITADALTAKVLDGAGGSDFLLKKSCRAFHSANQAIGTGALTVLAFDSERFDDDAIHDPATNNSRLTCKSAGRYLIFGTIEFAASAAGTQRQARIRLNGATDIDARSVPVTAAGLDHKLGLATIYELAVNDYVELLAYQDSGANLNVLSTGNYSPEFGIARIG